VDRFALHLTGGGNEAVSASRCLRKKSCAATSDARGLLTPPLGQLEMKMDILEWIDVGKISAERDDQL